MAKVVEAGRSALGAWRVAGWSFAAALVLAPLVAMQFTREVNWTLSDFIFAIIMIGGTGALLELAVRKSASWAYRGGVAVALLAAFLLIWINAAVGIIGSEDNPLNLLYAAPVAIALGGALIARFRPAGMALAMVAAMAVTAAIGLAALVAGWGAAEPPGAFGVMVLNGGFAGLWLLSALLLRSAARG